MSFAADLGARRRRCASPCPPLLTVWFSAAPHSWPGLSPCLFSIHADGSVAPGTSSNGVVARSSLRRVIGQALGYAIEGVFAWMISDDEVAGPASSPFVAYFCNTPCSAPTVVEASSEESFCSCFSPTMPITLVAKLEETQYADGARSISTGSLLPVMFLSTDAWCAFADPHAAHRALLWAPLVAWLEVGPALLAIFGAPCVDAAPPPTVHGLPRASAHLVPRILCHHRRSGRSAMCCGKPHEFLSSLCRAVAGFVADATLCFRQPSMPTWKVVFGL